MAVDSSFLKEIIVLLNSNIQELLHCKDNQEIYTTITDLQNDLHSVVRYSERVYPRDGHLTYANKENTKITTIDPIEYERFRNILSTITTYVRRSHQYKWDQTLNIILEECIIDLQNVVKGDYNGTAI